MDKVRDPFDRIDSNKRPELEEQILLDRIEQDYYKDIVDWFHGNLLRTINFDSVLEVGCGTGHLLQRLCELAPTRPARVAGVDLSEHLAKNAQQRFPSFRISAQDGRNLQFEPNAFDLTYASTVLVHAPQPDEIVREMARVTRPGGVVAVLDQDFETATLHPGNRGLIRRVLNAATDFWENGWIGRELPAYFQDAGLVDIHVEARVRVDRRFDPGFFARIRDWLIGSGFPKADASAWYSALADAKPGEFFFSRNFYCVTGRVPR
jgi:ubiquinone/menaquinone biosynthesis C-methylase UbiE